MKKKGGQKIKKLQCGDFILTFGVTKQKEAQVEFMRRAGKRVWIKFGKEEENEKKE